MRRTVTSIGTIIALTGAAYFLNSNDLIAPDRSDEIIIVVGRSLSEPDWREEPAQLVVDKVLEELSMNADEYVRREVIVRILVPTNSSLPQEVIVKLDRADHLLARVVADREVAIEQFRSRLAVVIKGVLSKRYNYVNSPIVETLKEGLDRMKGDGNVHRQIYLVGDFLQDSRLCDLDNEEYDRTPQLIEQHEDSLSERLQASGLTYLGDAEVVFLYHNSRANPGESAKRRRVRGWQTYYAVQLFKRYFQSLGATDIELIAVDPDGQGKLDELQGDPEYLDNDEWAEGRTPQAFDYKNVRE